VVEAVTAGSVNKIIAGETQSYLIGTDGELYLLSAGSTAGNDPIAFVNARGEPVVAVEHGRISYDAKSGKWSKVAEGAYGVAEPETKGAFARLRELFGKTEEEVAKQKEEENSPSAKVLKCMQIMAKQKLGASLAERMISDNVALAGVTIVRAAANPAWLDSEKERRKLAADFVTTNTGSGVGRVGDSVITWAKLSGARTLPVHAARFGANNLIGRTAYGVALNGTQQDSDEERAKAEKIANFNTVHGLARIPVNAALDNYMRRKLPEALFNGCSSGSVLRVVVTPTLIRIVERSGSTLIYLGARKALVGE
jgi:hypothetical protein